MTDSGLSTINYEAQDREVSWRGVSMADEDSFDAFITSEVASRLRDREAANEFEAHLRGLANTGFARDNLNRILAAEVPEERSWAVCEALAEAYLEREHNITWPWNMEREKRTPKACLPGADLVGFEVNGDNVRLALGEVKASSEERYPPQLMNGRSGHMGHQIDDLATNLGLIYQLFKWLWIRCKSTKHEASFNAAMAVYLDSGNRAVALFGVLVRDTQPNELDLKARGKTLAGTLQDPATCQLVAIYLPCGIGDLPARVSGGGS